MQKCSPTARIFHFKVMYYFCSFCWLSRAVNSFCLCDDSSQLSNNFTPCLPTFVIFHPFTLGMCDPARRDGVWSYFLKTCAANLHVVLCMSPAGDALRNRCRSFPGLVGSTCIDWMFPWPEQALFAVARVFLAEHPKIPLAQRVPIIEHVVHVHNSVKHYSAEFLAILKRKNFVTPKHYLDYINNYMRLIEETDVFIDNQCLRLANGIQKIDEASVQIDELSLIVEEQRKNVLEAAQKCEVMLVGIEQCKYSLKITRIPEKHKLYAGYGPFYAHAHSNRCSQCDRFLYLGDGPSYYFRINAHTGFPSFLRSGLRCDYTQALYKTVRRALAGTLRRACAGGT
jgi:P-loop containing dynein motor region D4